MGTTINAQFSIDIGYNIGHFYNENKPVINTDRDIGSIYLSNLKGSYSLSYTHNRLNVSLGVQRLFYTYPSKRIEFIQNGDIRSFRLNSKYINTLFHLVKKEQITLSFGIGFHFKHNLEYTYFIYYPEVQSAPSLAFLSNNSRKLALLTQFEYAPTEFTVFRFKANLIMRSKNLNTIYGINPDSAYLLYQISYGIYL